MSTSVIVSREVTDEIVGRLTGISPSYYRLTGNIRDLNIITANAQKKWDALLAIANSQTIDPRWADIDFDKVNAELRDLRAQVGRLQAHIDRTQPVAANAEGYVEAPTPAHGEVEYFGLEPWERDKLTSPTAGMNIAQRILHVGGRNNEAGYVEFGSIQAVEALVRQVLRDLPAQGGPNA